MGPQTQFVRKMAQITTRSQSAASPSIESSMSATSGVKLDFPRLDKAEFYPTWAKGMEFALKAANLLKIGYLAPNSK